MAPPGLSRFLRVLLLALATLIPLATAEDARTMESVFKLSAASSIVFLKNAPLPDDKPKGGFESGSERFLPIGPQRPIMGELLNTMQSLGSTELEKPHYPWSGIISTLAILDKKGDLVAVVRVWSKFAVFSVSSGKKLQDGSFLTVGGAPDYCEGANMQLSKWVQNNEPTLKKMNPRDNQQNRGSR